VDLTKEGAREFGWVSGHYSALKIYGMGTRRWQESFNRRDKVRKVGIVGLELELARGTAPPITPMRPREAFATQRRQVSPSNDAVFSSDEKGGEARW